MRRSLAHAALIALAAATLPGCGHRTPSDTEQVRSVLTTFATATEKRDYQTICDRVLAPRLLSGLQEIGLPCEVALSKSLGSVQGPRLAVDKVDVQGRTATARVRTTARNQPPSTDTLRLVKVKDGWRISALGSGQG